MTHHIYFYDYNWSSAHIQHVLSENLYQEGQQIGQNPGIQTDEWRKWYGSGSDHCRTVTVSRVSKGSMVSVWCVHVAFNIYLVCRDGSDTRSRNWEVGLCEAVFPEEFDLFMFSNGSAHCDFPLVQDLEGSVFLIPKSSRFSLHLHSKIHTKHSHIQAVCAQNPCKSDSKILDFPRWTSTFFTDRFGVSCRHLWFFESCSSWRSHSDYWRRDWQEHHVTTLSRPSPNVWILEWGLQNLE